LCSANLYLLIALTEAQVKKDLAEEEEQRLQDGGISLHEITASSFVAGGLELEEFQCVL
jgi:hypothetical protein